MPNTFTTDQELVNAIIANDSDASREAAWKAFVMQYKNLIYSIAVGGFRFRDHDADDVFQAISLPQKRRNTSARASYLSPEDGSTANDTFSAPALKFGE